MALPYIKKEGAMAVDPKSLRMAADQTNADWEAKREAERRTAMAKYPQLLAQFLSAVERLVEGVARCGRYSVVVLEGSGDHLRFPCDNYSGPDRDAWYKARLLLADIAELNGFPCFPDRIDWTGNHLGAVDLGDFSRRVVSHFVALGFRAEGCVTYNAEAGYHEAYQGKVELSW
jgi:hypothetical protein